MTLSLNFKEVTKLLFLFCSSYLKVAVSDPRGVLLLGLSYTVRGQEFLYQVENKVVWFVVCFSFEKEG